MYVSLSNIAVEFTEFDFDFEKKTFPKVTDSGKATCSATFGSFVKFDIVVDNDAISVDKVEAEVTITELPIKIEDGKHKFMLNMLVSLFSAKVMESVGREIKAQIDGSIPLLQQKIAAVTAGFTPDLKGKISGVKSTVKHAVEDDDEFDAAAVRIANELNGRLITDVEAYKKTRVIVSNQTPYTFRLKDPPDMPTQVRLIYMPRD